jgi:hypothetical protein
MFEHIMGFPEYGCRCQVKLTSKKIDFSAEEIGIFHGDMMNYIHEILVENTRMIIPNK